MALSTGRSGVQILGRVICSLRTTAVDARVKCSLFYSTLQPAGIITSEKEGACIEEVVAGQLQVSRLLGVVGKVLNIAEPNV